MAPYHQGDQRAEGGAQRRHPGAQLPDAGNLPLRRRLRRRLAAARASRPTKVEADIIVQCGVHFMAETSKTPEPGQDRADPGPARRLLAGGHRSPAPTCGCCASAIPACRSSPMSTPPPTSRRRSTSAAPRPTRVQVVESLGAPTGDLPARPVSGEICRPQTKREDHRLAGRLRGARALHRRGAAQLSRGRSVGADHRPSGMPARRAGGGRLHRLDRGA